MSVFFRLRLKRCLGFFFFATGGICLVVPCAWEFVCMGLLGHGWLKQSLTPVPTGHGCALPYRYLPLPTGILLAPTIHKLFLPPTDTLCLCLCAAALVWRQKPSGRTLFFPTTGNGLGSHPALLQALPLLLQRWAPRAILGRRVPLQWEVLLRLRCTQGR